MRCQFPGCRCDRVVDCLQESVPVEGHQAGDVGTDAVRIVYYCLTHCVAQGYCWGCGFQLLPDEFTHLLGLCPSCLSEVLER